jgi:hypothetical protein
MSKSVHFSESEFPKEFPVITKKTLSNTDKY